MLEQPLPKHKNIPFTGYVIILHSAPCCLNASLVIDHFNLVLLFISNMHTNDLLI